MSSSLVKRLSEWVAFDTQNPSGDERPMVAELGRELAALGADTVEMSEKIARQVEVPFRDMINRFPRVSHSHHCIHRLRPVHTQHDQLIHVIVMLFLLLGKKFIPCLCGSAAGRWG